MPAKRTNCGDYLDIFFTKLNNLNIVFLIRHRKTQEATGNLIITLL